MSKEQPEIVHHPVALRPGRHVSLFGHRPITELVPTELPDDMLRAALVPARHGPEQLWAGLPLFHPEDAYLRAHHLIVRHHEDPVGLLYDHLRTRLLQALQEHGWSRVAITAPTLGCGASTVAANLALALARRPSGRTLLVDLDLRRPMLAERFGISDPGRLRDVLTGVQPMEGHICRVTPTLALGLNDHPEADAAELLQEPGTADVLEGLLADLSPDVVLYDLPPMLESDDAIGFLPEVDGVLLIADATRTSAAQITECERLIDGRVPLIGVVLNRAEDSPARPRPRRRRWRRG